MISFLKKISYGAWLGFSLSICDIHFYEWQFYLVLVPTVIFISLFYVPKQQPPVAPSLCARRWRTWRECVCGVSMSRPG